MANKFKQEVEIVLKAKDAATKESAAIMDKLKKQRRDFEKQQSKGGGPFGDKVVANMFKAVSAMAQIEAGFQAANVTSEAIAGNWEAAGEAVKQMPLGIGAVAQKLEPLLGTLTGIRTETERLNQQRESGSKTQASLTGIGVSQLETRARLDALLENFNAGNTGGFDRNTLDRDLRRSGELGKGAQAELNRIGDEITQLRKQLLDSQAGGFMQFFGDVASSHGVGTSRSEIEASLKKQIAAAESSRQTIIRKGDNSSFEIDGEITDALRNSLAHAEEEAILRRKRITRMAEREAAEAKQEQVNESIRRSQEVQAKMEMEWAEGLAQQVESQRRTDAVQAVMSLQFDEQLRLMERGRRAGSLPQSARFLRHVPGSAVDPAKKQVEETKKSNTKLDEHTQLLREVVRNGQLGRVRIFKI